jgi:hypothetical protein
LRTAVVLSERDAAAHPEGAAPQTASSRASDSDCDVLPDGVFLPRGGHG